MSRRTCLARGVRQPRVPRGGSSAGCAGQAPLRPAGNALRCSCPSPWARWHNTLRLKAAGPFLSPEEPPGRCIVPLAAGGAGWHRAGHGLSAAAARPPRSGPSGQPGQRQPRRSSGRAGAGWGAPGSGAAPALSGASATPRSAPHPGGAGGTGGGAGCRGEGAGCGGGRGAAIPRAGTAAAADGGKVSGHPLPAGCGGPLPASPRGGRRCSRAVDPAAGAPLPPLPGGERGRRGRGCPPPRLPPFLPPGRGADAGFVSACPGRPRRARVAAVERGPPGRCRGAMRGAGERPSSARRRRVPGGRREPRLLRNPAGSPLHRASGVASGGGLSVCSASK